MVAAYADREHAGRLREARRCLLDASTLLVVEGTGRLTRVAVSGTAATATVVVERAKFTNPNEAFGPYGQPIGITAFATGTFPAAGFTYSFFINGTPIATSLGIGSIKQPTITAFSMDLNGNAITVSNELYDRMMAADPEAMKANPISARALKKVIDADKAAGKEPMTFAMVFPVSTHNYEIRYWMASAGINPDTDVRLIVIPPPQMVANLKAGNIVGYCVGEPWNERAVEEGIGRTLITNYEIWNNKLEKVFGVNQSWAEKNPNTHKAAVMALLEAAQWMDKPENRMEVVKLIAQKSYVNAPENIVKMSMTGTFSYVKGSDPRPLPDFNVFYRYAATYPWASQAATSTTSRSRRSDPAPRRRTKPRSNFGSAGLSRLAGSQPTSRVWKCERNHTADAVALAWQT